MKVILAILLLAVFLAPVATQFSHVVEGHEHEVCTSNDTHLHQNTTDCAVCHFQFAPFQYDVAQYSDTVDIVIPTKYQGLFSPEKFSSPLFLLSRLRGPPQILG